MNSPLGINAFRSSLQVFAQHCPKPCNRLPLPPLGSTSRRYLSSLLQHRPLQYNQGPRTGLSGPSRICRPVYQSRPSGLQTFKISFDGVVVNYVDLPPNYQDEIGLPFLRRDLETREVVAIFGPGMSTHAANKLLRILHGRRVAGTLDDPSVKINTMGYSKQEQKIALDYLRKKVPVDEIINAGLKAEDELAMLEGQEVEELEAPKVSKLFHKATEEKKGEESKLSIYGEGVFDAIRARNKARMEEEIRKREEDKQKKEEELAKLTPGELAKIEQQTTRQVSARMKEWQEKATSDLEAPPEMKNWERILPTAVVVLLVTGLLVAYAEFYRAPKRRDRLWPDIPPAAATVVVLLGLNVVGFALWKTPQFWRVLNKYFLIVPATPKPLSPFAAMFSHQALFKHLLPNMMVIWIFGTAFHDDVGRGNFLATYLGTGALSGLVSMSAYVLRSQLYVSLCGASGAIYGIAAAYFWLHRFEDFRVFGLPPEPMNGIPGLAFLGLAVGINIIGLFRLSVHNIDVIAHLSGAVFGVIAAMLIEKKQEAKRTGLQEKKETGSPAPSLKPTDKSLGDNMIMEKKA